jgi:hypothetical protein
MAKGQMKGNKEAKKPKADKPKSGGSAYKLSQGSGGQSAITPTKKKYAQPPILPEAAFKSCPPPLTLEEDARTPANSDLILIAGRIVNEVRSHTLNGRFAGVGKVSGQ